MTSGKLLHMKTSSPYAQNPVAVEASEMTNGVIMKIEGDLTLDFIDNQSRI